MNKIYCTSEARYGEGDSLVVIPVGTLDSENPVRDTMAGNDKSLHHSDRTIEVYPATCAIDVDFEMLSNQLLHLMSRCGTNTWTADCVRETV